MSLVTTCDATLLHVENVQNPTPTKITSGAYAGQWQVLGSFTVKGDFSRYDEEAYLYEYRQEIKGQLYMLVSGLWLPISAQNGPAVYSPPGQPTEMISATVYQEDGCGADGHLRYGHRNEAQHCTDDYYDGPNYQFVDRTNGPYYRATDEPGITHIAAGVGIAYKIDLHFRGKVVRVDSGGTETLICVKEWSVFYQGIINPGP